MGVGAGLYMCDVVVKSSRSLSHLLMSSCRSFGSTCETASCPVRELAIRELAYPRVVQLPFCTWCGLIANLECRSEMCCTRLAGNTGRKNDAKNRHLRTIAQLCLAVSSQLKHVSTIGKNCYTAISSPDVPTICELRPTNG